MVELIITLLIIGILAAIAIGAFQYYISRAYNITVKHDLKSFADAQEVYLSNHNIYHGRAGDYIAGGNPPSGSLVSAEFNFRPSEGVKIEIIGHGDAFTAQASHKSATKKYKYNFATGQITEEDA
jgi:Tfp pilus assembly protein PilE